MTDARSDGPAPVAAAGGVLALAGFALLVVEVVHTLTGGILGSLGTVLLWVGVGALAVGLLLLVLSLAGGDPDSVPASTSDDSMWPETVAATATAADEPGAAEPAAPVVPAAPAPALAPSTEPVEPVAPAPPVAPIEAAPVDAATPPPAVAPAEPGAPAPAAAAEPPPVVEPAEPSQPADDQPPSDS